jgi:hypothetical protein
MVFYSKEQEINQKKKINQKNWKLVYINLIGSTLYYYKNIEDSEPKGVIQLTNLTLYRNENEGDDTKKFCFVLKNKKDDYLFAAEEENDYKEWIQKNRNEYEEISCTPA